MRNSYLQDLIQKLKKRNHKIIYADKLKQVIAWLMKDEYSDTKAYKLIYYLKNKWHLVSLKKNIFFVKPAEEHLSEDLIIEDCYRQILHQHCSDWLKRNRYIWWIKALELNVNNYEIPEEILIVTPSKQSKEVVIAWKTMQCKKYTQKSENYFPKFKKFTTKMKVGKYSFSYAKLELALLESLYNYDEFDNRYTFELVKKVCKKQKSIDMKLIRSIIKLGKHHTSINRLKKICDKYNPKLSDELLPLIKKYSFILDV